MNIDCICMIIKDRLSRVLDDNNLTHILMIWLLVGNDH